MSLEYTAKPGEVILTFDGDSPTKTNIFSSTHSATEPLYTIHPEYQKSLGWHKATIIQKTADAGSPAHLLATIQYRSLTGDRIAFNTEEKTSPITVEKYLHGKLSHYEEFAFEDDKGTKYKWHSVDEHTTPKVGFAEFTLLHPHNCPQLYLAEDLSTPIAELHSHGLNPSHAQHFHSKSILVLSPQAVEIQDQIIVSFIWLLNKNESWLADPANVS
ncbi:hypothetical protein SISSUDRAFT_215328 [Sistotremastrum suecicum HHB10207 ss-3]|uniref:DUF6593 domain-containing protein n=1 Tax=Sistotremastrum suecicum HHB10207 ss-3 TaxID=1314776 RepID=A0A166A745_9AGAM|nr:hypothetical protein SISSUDRAFT_215328 [Sistotremastrum suecicum HHB10207 ss-3]